MPGETQTTVFLPPEIHAAWVAESRETGRWLKAIARDAFREYLAHRLNGGKPRKPRVKPARTASNS